MKRLPDTLEIIVVVTIVLVLVILFFFRGQSSSIGVATINIDQLHRRLGRDVIMNQALQRRQAALQSELQQVLGMLQQTLTAKQQEFGEAPTQEQAGELLALKRQLDAAIEQRKLQARQALDAFRLQLIREFRDEVVPVARRVAAGKGARLVLVDNPDFLLSADPSMDITEHVLAELAEHTRKPGRNQPAHQTREPSDTDTQELELPGTTVVPVP
jgi:Skp family chaperone for outer membrane proteins